jgi:hypothetical protein
MPSSPILKALGLNISPNPLELPSGSLTQASNVIIRRDSIIESRRGIKVYDNGIGVSTDRAKQLATYKNRILVHYSNKLAFDNGTKDDDGLANFDDFAGNYSETQTGLRIKSIESNGNFYFTTSEGVHKISAASASDLTTASGYITSAGGIKALDFTAETEYVQGNISGIMPGDSAAAYRVVWGNKDKNNNLILGSPSEYIQVYNPLLTLILQDFVKTLVAIDNLNIPLNSLITDGDYLSQLWVSPGLSLSSSASDLAIQLSNLATKLDKDIKYTDKLTIAPSGIVISSNVVTITFTTTNVQSFFSPQDKILISGSSLATLNTNHTITSVTASTITFSLTTPDTTLSTATIESYNFRGGLTPSTPGSPSDPATHNQLITLQNYLKAIVTKLQNQPVGVVSITLNQNYLTPLVATTSSDVKLTITIPEEIDQNYFVQIYRTSIVQATGTSVLSTDVFPGDEMQLVYEAYPTAQELTDLEMIVIDITPDDFRGAFLYTNASTGEGILQSNDPPPFAKDINKFKNVAFYANTRTSHKKLFTLLPIQTLIDNYAPSDQPQITIVNQNGTSNTYSFVLGEPETTLVQTVAGSILNTGPTGKYFYLNSVNDINEYFVWFQPGAQSTPVVPNKTPIQVNISPTDSAIDVAKKLANTLSQYPEEFNVKFVTFPANVGNASSNPITSGVDTSLNQIITYLPHNLVDGDIVRFSTTGTLPTGLTTGVDYYVTNSGSQYFKLSSTYPSITPVTISSVGSGLHTVFSKKVEIENAESGYCTAASDVSTTFTITQLLSGAGEDENTKKVLLSNAVSPAQAVDETARSLVRVINKNTNENVYAYYLSGPTDIPGKFAIEARVLNTQPFYIVANNDVTGFVFNPDISPTIYISSITPNGSITDITTADPHNLQNKDTIVISGSDSNPSVDGYYEITNTGPNTFSINKNITGGGSLGGLIKSSEAIVTENEDKPNRVYYSKLDQPEAVPSLNYFDVGAGDKAILRIFPLRDTLFVLKEDGLFRISGEVSPFTLSLFDSSCILTAPDSVSVANNNIYAWTTQGIQNITESGVTTISRPIDTEILKVSSSSYTNFKTATWGVGYDSDNSYTVYTIKNVTDSVATMAFRFSNLTNSWTSFDLSKTCGIINFTDDRLYLGASDINNIEQERKSFSRYDYSDREYKAFLGIGSYFNTELQLADVSKMSVGDVITQTQTLSPYLFNSLLKKLDLDPGFSDNDYESSLLSQAGDNMRIKLEELAQKLDADIHPPSTTYYDSIESKNGSISSLTATGPTIITSNNHGLLTGRIISISNSNTIPSIDGIYEVTNLGINTFSINASVTVNTSGGTWSTLDLDYRDLEVCYNEIISKLNAEPKPAFGNYLPITSQNVIEAIITNVNNITKRITLNVAIDFIVGEIEHYTSITTKFTYAPNHFQNPLTYKHFREMTVMFLNKAFTSATVRVATDLLPQLIEIPFNGDGNGIFGYTPFGQGFFGGNSHPVPFRTYIPRQCQRCRYIVVQFEHKIAREQYGITGMTLTGDEYSTRAYR